MSQIGTEKPEGDLSLARPSVDGLEIEIVKGGDEPALRITFREHVRSLGFAHSRAHVRLEALGPDMLEVALQVEDERPQWNEDRTWRWGGSRLFGQRIRPHGHPESFSPGKIDEDGPELFPPDHLRGNRSRATPAKGRGGLGGEQRGEPLSAHEGGDELSVVDHLVGQAGILIAARAADAVERLGGVERKGLGTRLDGLARELAGRGGSDV